MMDPGDARFPVAIVTDYSNALRLLRRRSAGASGRARGVPLWTLRLAADGLEGMGASGLRSAPIRVLHPPQQEAVTCHVSVKGSLRSVLAMLAAAQLRVALGGP